MTFCQSHYTFRHNTMTCQIKQPDLSAGLLIQPNIPRNIIAPPLRSRVYFYIPAYTPPSLLGAQQRGNHPLSLPRVHRYTFIYPHIHHRHCEERSDVAISTRHCEERSDVAIILCHSPAFAGILLYTPKHNFTSPLLEPIIPHQNPPEPIEPIDPTSPVRDIPYVS